MARKVYGTAVLTYMVPMQVTADFIIRAEEGANIANILKRHIKGETHRDGEVELLTIEDEKGIEIHGYDLAEEPCTGAQEALDRGIGGKLVSMTVEDSKLV